MSAFHVFQIAQMVPNRTKPLIRSSSSPRRKISRSVWQSFNGITLSSLCSKTFSWDPVIRKRLLTATRLVLLSEGVASMIYLLPSITTKKLILPPNKNKVTMDPRFQRLTPQHNMNFPSKPKLIKSEWKYLTKMNKNVGIMNLFFVIKSGGGESKICFNLFKE